ncbi:alpha-N-arabinofuranosidase [Acutalibacter caecimuris]|uniref:alpha-N-arabinofuranosidase n=1 Tax=Acutalibacter caecimuris TaxID=3093657 RepID=UPI002AC99DC0|nr:alpha-L-arabinofuranosidase C-terminal domain-containing protein [Acutalibacter sp. M00118]
MQRIIVNTLDRKGTINRNIYGNFSEHLGRCIYNGLFVGEGSPIPNVNGMRTDVVEALRAIRLPVLRWPGGCFADEYHWKDGIGPRESRKRMVNTHWGGVVEDNAFGTHEFMELCRQVGCAPYINGNLGSGTVQEMSEWVEYMTFDGVSPMALLREQNGRKEPWELRYFGVGNENWGCGGNMRPAFYADQFRRYQTYCRNYGDNRLFKIACGPNSDDYDWTDQVMEIAGNYMDGLSLHYYTVPSGNWADKGAATGFTKGEYYATLKAAGYMEELVARHCQIMDRHDPLHKVGLVVDEWGTWYNVEPGTNPGFLYQQNTMRDAMVAALTLHIFNRHCDRVVMANIAQLVNVLQAVILTEGDKMVLTPTYHVFDLYQCHQDATLLGCFATGREVEGINSLTVCASADRAGAVHITAANLDADNDCPVEVELLGKDLGQVSGRLLAGGMGAYNDFDHPHDVQVTELAGIKLENGRACFTLPACSVGRITLA